MSSPSPQPSPELRALVEKAINREQSPAEGARLDRLLADDEQARRYYLEMVSLDDAVRTFTRNSTKFPLWVEPPPRKVEWKRPLAALGIAAAVSLAALWAFLPSTKPYRVGSSTVPGESWKRGEKIQTGIDLAIGEGSMELVSPNGAVVIFSGPATFRLESAEQIALQSGQLLANSHGKRLRVKTGGVSISNVGTIYGVERKIAGETRVDVIEGEVRCLGTSNRQEKANFVKGAAAIVTDRSWPPVTLTADPIRYQRSFQAPVGLNFNHPDAPKMSGASPYDATWTEATEPIGSAIPRGATFTVDWISGGISRNGSSTDPEAHLFTSHLMGYAGKRGTHPLWKDIVGESADYGNILRLRGMSAWMEKIGAVRYRITVLRDSAIAATFEPIEVISGPTTKGQSLGKFPVDQSLPGLIPEVAVIARQAIPREFDQDALVLVTAFQSLEPNTPRANISAVIVTPVFPASETGR